MARVLRRRRAAGLRSRPVRQPQARRARYETPPTSSMIAPPRCWSSSGVSPANPSAWRVERARGEGEQRPEQRHVHRGEQQPDDSGAGTAAAAPRIAAEGGQPHEQAGEEKHPLLGHQPRRAVPRRVMQRRRVPGPHHDQLHDRGRNRREQPAGPCAPDRAGLRRAPSARSGAATATTPMCIVMCAKKACRASCGSGPSQTAASVSKPRISRLRRISGRSR